MQGWIKLHRKIQENEIWMDEEPFDRRSAFIDLLLMANHKDKKVIFNGQVIEIEAGQRITSIRNLSERWRWSVKKVVRFLDMLEMLEIIERKSDRQKTLITIVNYGFYQGMGNTNDYTDDHTEETQRKHEVNTEETPTTTQRKHQRPINKNDKNDKNEKNEKNDKNEEEVYISKTAAAQKIVDIYHIQCPSLPRVAKLTDARIKAINARLKEYSEEDIETAFVKAENSAFLRGDNGKWKAGFDWIMNPNNIVKILEGNYDDRIQQKKDNFNSMLEEWAKGGNQDE